MRAIFLDRDGVICENRSDYVKSWHEFQFLPGAKRSLAALSRLGLPIIVVTNQSMIGRGLISADTVEEIHERMAAEVAAYGGRIDRIIYCPHHPEERCGCRKPKPGMLVRAAEEIGIDLTRSYFVGDAVSDLLAAQQVGCQPFLVLTGRGFQQLISALCLVNQRFTVTHKLMGATNHILRAELQIIDRAEEQEPYTRRYSQLLRPITDFRS
jgi:D-glycero-D-manno-heptose 1,7-bisphosphate phosphatase